MNIVLTISLCISCITRFMNTPDSTSRRVYSEYVCDEVLSEFEFIKPYKDNYYTLSFEEDTIPYIVGTDSLFRFNLCGDGFCMYYNTDVFRNTGLVLMGDERRKEVAVIYTGIIDSADAYIADRYIIIRIKERLESFGSPSEINTKYIVSSLDNDSIIVLTLLSNCSTWLDSSRIALLDEFSFPEIHMHGIIDDLSVDFIILITEDVMPSIINYRNLWNGLNIIEKQSLVPKKYHYDKKD